MRELHRLHQGVDQPLTISRYAFGDRVTFAPEPSFRLARAIDLLALMVSAAFGLMMLSGFARAIAGGRL